MFDWVTDFSAWIWDTLKAVAWFFIEIFVDLFIGVLSLIPVPEFLEAIPGYFSALPPEVFWAFDLFAVEQGLSMMLSAMQLRWTLKAVPGWGG